MKFVYLTLNQKMISVLTQLSEVHQMTIDKNKLKELIQKTLTKDLLYLHFNPVEPKSLQSARKELQKDIGKSCAQVIVVID